jgi:lipoyl(octanoyl) transferase
MQPIGPATLALEVIDLGRMPYREACAVQHQRRDAAVARRERLRLAACDALTPRPGEADLTLYLVEHDPPVITVSRRPGAAGHLLASPQQLARLGIEVCETDRGGDITYHGPGQLIAWPIFDLQRLGLGVASYLRLLERIIIDTLRRFEIAAHRDDGATGVWVDGAKICAMGVRVSRWITTHGLALNVHTELAHFDTIVPCGLAGRPVTSMAKILGPAAPTMEEVKKALVSEFRTAVATDRG